VTETTSKPTKDGIGPAGSAAYGRYELDPAEGDAGASAGLYAPVVRAASALVEGTPQSGSLTIAAGSSGPTATVTLKRPDADEVVYLSDFQWRGSRRTATVHRDSAAGPSVGTFAGTIEGATLSGTLTVDGTKTTVSFTKTS
jgi:hypothetical protein